jgi:mannose-6-phosphate isomerase-like protein (cupin superfamily)
VAVGVALGRRSRSTAQPGRETGEGREAGVVGRRDDAVENPLIGHEFRLLGDRFRVLESARQTADGSLRADYFAAPRANVPEHVHHPWEDCFEVLSGRLGVRVGGRELTLGPGQSAVVPPGVSHAWWNPSGDEEVHFLAEMRPGLDVETMLETVLGLAREGKTIGEAIPKNPLQLAVLAEEFGSWGYFTAVPRPVRRALFAPVRLLAFFGRLFGYRARYPEYSGAEAGQPIRIAQNVDIRCSLEEVFAFVADPRNDTHWTPAVEEVHKTSEGPLGAGTMFEAVFRLLGRRFVATFKIAEYEPNRKVVLEPPTSGPVQLVGTRSVEVVPGGARLSITIEGRTGGFFRVAEPIFARLASRQLKASLADLKDLLEFTLGEQGPAEPSGTLPASERLLPLISALWLLNSAIGARIAIHEDLPAGWVADLYVGRDASTEFFKGGGTALSPGLPMMGAQALFTVLSTSGGKAGKAGAAGLTVLGAGGTVGVLAETITYRVLSPRTFDVTKAPIVSAAIVLSPLMTILGASRLRALRGAR